MQFIRIWPQGKCNFPPVCLLFTILNSSHFNLCPWEISLTSYKLTDAKKICFIADLAVLLGYLFRVSSLPCCQTCFKFYCFLKYQFNSSFFVILSWVTFSYDIPFPPQNLTIIHISFTAIQSTLELVTDFPWKQRPNLTLLTQLTGNPKHHRHVFQVYEMSEYKQKTKDRKLLSVSTTRKRLHEP